MIVLVNKQNGELLSSPVGFVDPTKSEAAPLEGAASGNEGKHPEKAFDARILQETQRQRKAFSTRRAEFALLGFELKLKKYTSGITLFEVMRHGQSREFSHFGDVGAYLTQLQQGGHHG